MSKANSNTAKPKAAEIRSAKILSIFFASLAILFCLFWSQFIEEKLNYFLIFIAYFCVSCFLSALLPQVLNGAVIVGIAVYSFGWQATDLYQQLGVLMPDFLYPVIGGLWSGYALGKNIGIPKVSSWLKTNEWVYDDGDSK